MLTHLNLDHPILARIDSLIASQHEQKRYRPTATALLESPKGKVLLGKSAKSHGGWGLLQGGVKPGENVVTALFRELDEEASFDPAVASECRFCYAGRWHVPDCPDGFIDGKSYFIFHVKCHAEPVLTLNTREVSECEWLRPHQVGGFLSVRASASKREMTLTAMRRAGLL